MELGDSGSVMLWKNSVIPVDDENGIFRCWRARSVKKMSDRSIERVRIEISRASAATVTQVKETHSPITEISRRTSSVEHIIVEQISENRAKFESVQDCTLLLSVLTVLVLL